MKEDKEQHCENISIIEELLRRVCFDIKKKGREILSDFNITPPQFDALQWILCKEELTIGELSSILYLAPSTITDLIDRMEKSELVYRIRDDKDRRVVKVRGSKKGYELLDKVLQERCTYLDDALKLMSDEDKKKFIANLELLKNYSK
ncbi:MarR family winged helix-turn-helix transcriptional regulator [Hathewaya massiliensis]|uniref:MarR family winged helix-turn-helix transcriptional regulator n=1 Tax=Hathewaya massiliensis TaxID=1964382 RepID=UPI00115BC145|nr:MarR family transcriptional regulator [Hathewaya massiliensis]